MNCLSCRAHRHSWISSATDCSPDGSLTGHTATGWHVSVSGADFWLELLGPHFHAEAVHEIWLCVTAGRGDRFSVYWHGPRESFHESRCVHADYRPGPHWEIVRVRLAGHPLWKGRIDGLRLDLFNGEGTVGTGTIRWVRVVE